MKKIIALLFSVSLSISLLSQDDLGKDDLRCMPKPTGRGLSKDPADSLLYEMMAGDYDALLEAMKIDSADVLGWSDAGINGLLLVIRHQQK